MTTAGQLPCLALAIARAVAAEDGDQSRRQRPGHDQLEDRIGDAEGSEVRVEVA